VPGKKRGSHFTRELTPLPELEPGAPSMSPRDAELRMCRATCVEQRHALSLQRAEIDDNKALIRELRADRRALAHRLRALEARLRRPSS
jgi:hypothetical protein